MSMHSHMVAVNPFNKTGIIRQIDKNRYKELQKRFKHALNYYKRNRSEIDAEYKNSRPYLTSEKFWRKYLVLDK